ncbi:hypothetical protein Tco_1236396 [Tanacetum coccineum]
MQLGNNSNISLARFRIANLEQIIEDIQVQSTSEAQPYSKLPRELVADSVVAALEAQAATMANADNTNRNTGEREAHVARKCSYKELMSCQPINFKGLEGAVGLIREKAIIANLCRKEGPPTTMPKEEPTWLRDRNAHQDPNVQKIYILRLSSFRNPSKWKEKNVRREKTRRYPIVREFPNVFPEDLPGLPPIEFQNPPSTLLGEAPVLICQKERQSFRMSKTITESQGLHVDPAKIKAVKNWTSPTTPIEIRQFLGLAGYYQRFIKDFSKIAKSLTELTQKNKKYIWSEDQESLYSNYLKQRLCVKLQS